MALSWYVCSGDKIECNRRDTNLLTSYSIITYFVEVVVCLFLCFFVCLFGVCLFVCLFVCFVNDYQPTYLYFPERKVDLRLIIIKKNPAIRHAI